MSQKNADNLMKKLQMQITLIELVAAAFVAFIYDYVLVRFFQSLNTDIIWQTLVPGIDVKDFVVFTTFGIGALFTKDRYRGFFVCALAFSLFLQLLMFFWWKLNLL